MDQFCGQPFWDVNLTWYTRNGQTPDFTRCFELTVLAWIPCAFLWIFGAISLYGIWTTHSKYIPWNALNVTKCISSIILAILQLILLFNHAFYAQEFYTVEIVTPCIRIATFVLSVSLIVYDRIKGVRSSGVLFYFWLLSSFCEVFTFRTELLNFNNEQNADTLRFVIEVIFFPVIVAQLLLSCWADAAPEFAEPTHIEICPEETSSYLSKLLFSWFDALALQGYRKPLEYCDLWGLNSCDKSRTLVPIFDKYWERERSKAKSKLQVGLVNPTPAPVDVKFSQPGVEVKSFKTLKEEDVNILTVLCHTFGASFLFGSFLKLFQDILMFVSPQILRLLIDFVSKDEEDWKGYFYTALLFITTVAQTIFLAQYFHRMFLIGMRLRAALVSAIYRKALVISNSARNSATVGEIVNLMSVDTQKIQDLIPYLSIVWSGPFQIGLSMYFLWQTLGPAVLAGLALLILMIPSNALIAAKMKKLQGVQMAKKDQRVKLMNEILSGIKVIKLYAWENAEIEQVSKIRDKEMKVLLTTAYLDTATSFMWQCAPFVVSLVTFGTYVLIDKANVLDAQKAFVSLTLFNILSTPLAMLPYVISSVVQASVSFKRLNKFLNSEEIDKNAVFHDPNEVDPIVIENGNFSWTPEFITLKDINIKIREGSLCAIVGEVGSGKSSLLSAILGEMTKLSGRVNTKGKIAYVAQQAWIQNASLRDNVLFGIPFNSRRYNKVLDTCQLKPDLEILPAGDKTEIGEKGINLSGGQKQRVSLARSAYNNADVYLLDDPLSAVDSHVGKHIFEKVLGPNGILKHKTRVLVTHGITHLPEVDYIIVLKNGEVTESGNYKELLSKKGAFADFLTRHLDLIDDEEAESLIIKDIEKLVGNSNEKENILTQRSRRISESGSIVHDSDHRQLSISSKEETVVPRKPSSTDQSITEGSHIQLDGEKLIQAEKSETGSVHWKIYYHYARSVGWQNSFWIIFLYIIFEGFAVFSNIWLSWWSNEVPTVNGTQDLSKRDMYLGVYAGLGIGQVVSVLLAGVILAIGMLKAAAILHTNMLRRIMRAPSWFFDTTPIGRIVNRFAKDVDSCDVLLPDSIRDLVACFFNVIATLVVISYSTPLFMFVVFPIGFVYYLIQRFYVATSRQLKRLESVSRSPIYSHFTETLTGCSTIRAFGVQERFILESEASVDYNQRAYFPSIVSNRWLAIRLETIGNLIILFAALFAVIGRKTLTPGLVGLSVSYALQITQVLNWMVRMTSSVESNIVAVERMKEYSEVEQEAPAELNDRKPPSSWPDKGMVEFKGYQTRYRTGLDLVLQNITVRIEPAEKIGIVGRTGSGKSSLSLGLFRLLEPASGTILIDDKDITNIGLYDLRSRLTIIPQDPVLFSGTLRINLDPFEQHNDEDLWRSLELAHLKSFVKGLPGGLNYEIAEGGQNLSVGQRQLVCLARALLRKSKILVLDEATAQVDLNTDELIQQTIRNEFKDSTVLTIAHRLNTILDSTRVMVMDKGEIKEFDHPDVLLKNKDSIFYQMAQDAGIV